MRPPLIDFLVEGKRFAVVSDWLHVPRVGEFVLIRDGEICLEVVRVVWSEDSSARAAGLERQWVQLVCKIVEKF